MQPNNNLVFYLADDDSVEQQATPSTPPNTMAVNDVVQPARSSNPNTLVFEALDDVAQRPESTAAIVDSADTSPQPSSEAVPPVVAVDAQDDVDWIASLEQIRHLRQQDQYVSNHKAQTHFGAQTEGSNISHILKVHTVTAAQLFEPAAAALAAGKDLHGLSHRMQEANDVAMRHHDDEAMTTQLTTPAVAVDDGVQSTTEYDDDGDVFSPFTANLKARAKQIPLEELPVETVAPLAHQPSDSGLLAKAHEVAEKTALSSDERLQILNGFLDLWQQRRAAKLATGADRQVMLHEEWLEQNEALLQTELANDTPVEQVLWLKTSSTAADDASHTEGSAMGEDNTAAAVLSDVLPDNLDQSAMYAPIHIHIALPAQLADDAPLSVISEAKLLAELSERLKPYFVNMLAGMVKTELNKQATQWMQHLQRNVEAEIPTMVDEVLQESLHQVLRDIKTS